MGTNRSFRDELDLIIFKSNKRWSCE